jgi:hypothetical protein
MITPFWKCLGIRSTWNFFKFYLQMIHFAIFLLYFEYLLNDLKDTTSKSEILTDFSSFSKTQNILEIRSKPESRKSVLNKDLCLY